MPKNRFTEFNLDPALAEAVESAPDQQVIEGIVRLEDPAQIPAEFRVICQFIRICTGRFLAEHTWTIRQHPNVISLKAARPLGISQSGDISPEFAKTEDLVWRGRRPLPFTGRGSIVAALDFGLDFGHPNFLNPDRTTRVISFWHQGAAYDATHPNRYGYGRVFSRDEINAALRTSDPYRALGYHPAISDTGNGSHGTHTLDIAAGNGRSPGSNTGIAPEAEIIFVHLSTPRLGVVGDLGDSVRMLEALDFAHRTAADRPCVVNLSVGREAGSHDATSPFEQAMHELLRMGARTNRAICQSAGNYGSAHLAVNGWLRDGEQRDLEWIVHPKDVSPELDAWYSGNDRFLVVLLPPDGGNPVEVRLGEVADINDNGGLVGRIYHRKNDPNNRDNHVEVFLYKGAPPGVWILRLIGEYVITGRFHAWIERAIPGAQSHFNQKITSRSYTLGTIATSPLVITVGAYDSNTEGNPLAPFSSCGPTRDERQDKPELLAPGVRVIAARSIPRHAVRQEGLLMQRSGTSMASPHLTGLVAAMFEAAGRPVSIAEIRDSLKRSAEPVTQAEYPNCCAWGRVNMEEAIRRIREPVSVAAPQEQPVVADAWQVTPESVTSDAATEDGASGEENEISVEQEEIEAFPEVDVESPRDAGALENSDLAGQFLDRAEEAVESCNGRRGQSEASFLQHLMSELGDRAFTPGLSPAALFRAAVQDQSPNQLRIVGTPLRNPEGALRAGDWLLRAASGTGDVGHVAVLAFSELLTPSSLSYQRIPAEGTQPGYYGIVIEGGAFPHSRKQLFARRFLDSRGRVPVHSVILRPQSPDSDPPEEYEPSTGFKIEQRDPSRSGEPYLDLEAADSTITREAEHNPGLLREDAAEDNFDPATIPKEVAQALSRKDWRGALVLAIRAGWHDENDLTDLLFFTRHPELPTQQLDPKNPKFKPLTAEWTAILAGEARPAIERASVDDTLKVSGNYVAERDPQFRGATGKKFRDLVEWAAGEVDINPGLLAAVLLAEWDKSSVYLSSGEVVTFLSGTDDFFEERAQLAANVPAFAQVHFDITKKTTNRNEAGRLVTTIPFNSGRDAALATAVYLKNGEIKLRKGAEKNGGDFDKLPAETRFALVRIAMAAGHGWISPDGTLVRAKWEVRKDGTAGCVRLAKGEKGGILCGVAARLEKVLAGKDILVRKNEPRQYPDTAHQTDRNATILTAQALHLSDWIFGKPLTAATQPAVPTSETWNTTQESVGEEAPTLSRAHPVASAALITAGCPDDAQLRQPLPLTEHCLNRLEGLHVAVVGGGLAGLMAARRLREHRVKVTLFEARGKVGGRVLSSDTFSNGRIIELGAELIGSFHTTWLALARHYGLAMISRMSEELYERSGLSTKLTLDKPLCMDEIHSLDEQMKTRALKPIAVLAQQIVDPSQPWKQDAALRAFDIPVAKALETYCKIDKLKDDRLWKMIEHLLVNDEVASLDEMNFLGLLCKVKAGQGPRFGTKDPELMGYWTELEIFRCADGCEALATSMAKEIQTDEGKTRQRVQFQLSTAVKGIDISKKGVILSVQQVQSNLKLADGAPIPVKQLYDSVILTIPPSVWDGVTVKVEGKEASLKTEIGMMGMGPAVKFFSDVKTRFWIAEKAAPYGGSLELGQVWEGTDNQTRVDNQGVVLSVFAGPIVGRKRVPTKDECLAGLKRLYPGYSGNLLKAHYSDWPNEPFIKTGYASPMGGQVLGIGRKLSEPFHDRMLFAGEHTQMDFFGYMEGALRSGERAAETIINQECGLNKAPEHFVASKETFAGASK